MTPRGSANHPIIVAVKRLIVSRKENPTTGGQEMWTRGENGRELPKDASAQQRRLGTGLGDAGDKQSHSLGSGVWQTFHASTMQKLPVVDNFGLDAFETIVLAMGTKGKSS